MERTASHPANRVVFGGAYEFKPGITHEPRCTFNGRATWGQRLSCAGCGEVEECRVGSSVSHEDSPGRFAQAHRGCNVEVQA